MLVQLHVLPPPCRNISRQAAFEAQAYCFIFSASYQSRNVSLIKTLASCSEAISVLLSASQPGQHSSRVWVQGSMQGRQQSVGERDSDEVSARGGVPPLAAPLPPPALEGPHGQARLRLVWYQPLRQVSPALQHHCAMQTIHIEQPTPATALLCKLKWSHQRLSNELRADHETCICSLAGMHCAAAACYAAA